MKRIDKLFKYVDSETKDGAKEYLLNKIEEEEKTKAENNNKVFNRNIFLMDYKIIDVVKQ